MGCGGGDQLGYSLPPSRGGQESRATAEDGEKYFFWFSLSPMGFGDRMRVFYGESILPLAFTVVHNLRLLPPSTAGYFLAMMSNRTFVLPPVHMTQHLWARDEKLANMRIIDVMRKHKQAGPFQGSAWRHIRLRYVNG